MVEYALYLPSPENYGHNACFMDQAVPLQAAFKDLGYDVPIVTHPLMERTNIVLGAHLLPLVSPSYAPMILYNLEQVAVGVPWISREYIALLKRYPVWDYSEWNLKQLGDMGVAAKLLPVAYHESMGTFTKAAKETDVLHYGSMNSRRMHVIHALEARGARVKHLFNIYGKDRDAEIAKAKVVLNVSYYESKIFNITRCGMLFANKVPVVSEMGPGSEALHGTGGFAEYDGLVEKCLEVLENPQTVGDKGFEIYSAMPGLTECLRGVLHES